MQSTEFKFYLSAEAKAVGLVFSSPQEGDAGYDIRALSALEIPPLSRALVPTGLHLEIPPHYVGLIRDRSSVALKGMMCGAGVIDSSYRGEVKVLMFNMNSEAFSISVGDRIAQLLLLPVSTNLPLVEVTGVEGLNPTIRGGGGFGSTGK